jgi:tetratricopeptide (TPR) repeat protein
MKTRQWQVLSLVAVVAAVSAAAAYWHHQTAERSTVVAMMPAKPDLTNVPSTMRERIEAADASAHSTWHAVEGLSLLARTYHANGFLDEAARCYEALERLDPREAKWAHLHATILAGFGDTGRAVGLWRRVTSLAPTYVPARLRMGDALLKANRVQEAETAYAGALQQDPENPYALFGLARIDFEAGRWEKAQERLEKVVAKTNYQLGYDLIVTLYERLGKEDRARAIRGAATASGAYRDPADPWLDGLVDVCFDPFRLSLNAGIAARVGDPAGAQALLERAVELSPNDVSVRFQLGTLAVKRGNVALATEQLQQCTVLAPEFSDAWVHLSALQEKQGNASAAERTLAEGLKNCPDSPGLHLMRARNLQKAGRADAAISEYSVAIRLRPNEPDAYIELGNLLIELDRVDEGLAQIRKVLEVDPANPAALSVLAFNAISTLNEADAGRWLARLRDQPRAGADTMAALRQAFRERFGHEWK